MGFKENFKRNLKQRRSERLQTSAARKDIRKQAIAAGLRAERTASIKAAEKRAIARANRPGLLSQVSSGIQTLSKVTAPPVTRSVTRKRKKVKGRGSVPKSTSVVTKNKQGIMDFKFI